MARNLNENDYLYATARLRALEAGLIGREKLERMLEAPSAADAMAQVGMSMSGRGDDPAVREIWFAARLSEAYAVVMESLPTPETVRFMQYPYDCNNIKAAIKCAARGIDPAPMLVEVSTLPAEAYVEMAKSQDFSALPAAMAEAAARAADAFSRTGDPQQIDLILDRACFTDMLDAASDEFSKGLVRCRIDLTNLMMLLRVMRMGVTPANRAMLEAALLSGGEIAAEHFSRALDGGEAKLGDYLGQTGACGEVLASFAENSEQPSLAALERVCDDVWMARVTEAKYISFGAAVPVAYLAAWEYAVKNMRIICAGKDAGLDTDMIRERMRASYV